MNKERKPRECSIPDEVIKELGERLKHEYLSWNDITSFIHNKCNKNWGIELILCILDTRGYKVAEGYREVSRGKKTFYKVFTKEDYEKIAEEQRENAKRRLLAAISY